MKDWSVHKSEVPLFAISTSHKCGWRAFYVSVRVQTAGANEWHQRQVFRLGIDPTASRPSIFGAVQWHRRGFSWRVPIKLISWRMVMRFPFLRRLYVWQGHMLFKLDGRF
jgi:hypothetical protein